MHNPASWWAHLHGSRVGATWEELLEGPSPEEVARAVALLEARRAEQLAGGGGDGGPPACCQESRQQHAEGGGEGAAGGGASSSSNPSTSSAPAGGGGGGGATLPGDGLLDIVPAAEWRSRLRSLLSAHPGSLVGEVGLDRAAVIPGSRARVRFDHQLALLEEQLGLAAELGRPVSVHCVRGYGHLLQLFQRLARGDGAGCPPAVMLHSYGGSPEDVSRFSRLPGVGPRFFFSFSSAINARNPDKLAARIRAVPDDRLLVESDQVTPLLIEGGMVDICRIVADAKGWGLEEAAARTLANFDAFYSRA
ncbi:MAG: hypothetical protein J3K34DRAFT_370036 [Monoraphidium minutum]|nr:MAG: hypothetical protein J3K34DRAFT_370036 [Monoraphidium minutum]